MHAYFDCFSGISGDMTLGALIDLGVPVQWIKESLQKHLLLKGFDLSAEPVKRHGLKGQKVMVTVKDDNTSRDYAAILSVIEKSTLSSFVKEKSLDIFEKLARAEAKIHNEIKEKVHFHEVGGVDALVDIVGTVLCMEYLNIQSVTASILPLGSGFVDCRHGTIPIPSPATVSILKGVPVYGSGIKHELVTPTGAAIIVSIADQFDYMPEMVIHKIGMGAGGHDFEKLPNLLRIITGQIHKERSDPILIVETCIDDMNPEIYGFLMDRLMEEGALDVYWIPIQMKKNRPGTMIQVLCESNKKETVIRRILTETTSIGLRFYEVHRRTLERDQVFIESEFGEIPVKRVKNPDGTVRLVPEYEVCQKIARDKNIPIRQIYHTISIEAGK